MKRVHLICNAHLDPIWQWTWDEGISSAIATFKSAANLADEFDYIFCHNESMLYETIEQVAPDLFEKIRELVKAGKWNITGGWYLQPDCLMPCGETFVRLISVGKTYFQEKFGVTTGVALNFDSFGHSLGLVQILAENGYKGYLICRPNKSSKFSYPGRFFKWVAPDGSEVLVSQSDSYSSFLGEAAVKIAKEAKGESIWMLGAEDGKENKGAEDIDYSLWGVGNHGGGPSRKDLRDISLLQIENTQIVHSTPDALFSENLNISGTVNTSLITVNPGCYSSMAKVKQAYRRAENNYYAVEKMLTYAKLAGVFEDAADMKFAEKQLLLTTFHDVLPGTCIEAAEREALDTIAVCNKITTEHRTSLLLKLSMSQDSAKDGEFPVFVFNYMPYPITTPIEVEFTLANQNWDESIYYEPHVFSDGVEVPSQTIKENSTINLDWRKRVVFEGTLQPLCVTRFTIKVIGIPRAPQKTAPAIDIQELLQTTDLLKERATFELYDDTADPWGMSQEELTALGTNPTPFIKASPEKIQQFFATGEWLSAERLIEDGAVFTGVEGVYTQQNTTAVLQYKLYKNQPFIDIKAIVEFGDKNKLLRLKFPLPKKWKNARPYGDGPFICEEKPNCEISFQKWLGVKNENGEIFAVLNNGVYGGKIENGSIHITLLRGAGYCFHPIYDKPLYPQDRYLPRIDSGKYVYEFRLYIGSQESVCQQAALFNQQPYAINVFPTGGTLSLLPKMHIDGEVILETVKPAEDGGYIFRIYNPACTKKQFTVTVEQQKITVTAVQNEVVSIKYDNGDFTVYHDCMPV